MKVAIFENEAQLVNTIFDATNFYYFNNEFKFEYFPSSQNLQPFSDISSYDIVFIDIALSPNSELDGFGVIRKINQLQIANKPKIIIMTGRSQVKEGLIERNLPEYPILNKPLTIANLKSALEH